jgi:hypothetical protein
MGDGNNGLLDCGGSGDPPSPLQKQGGFIQEKKNQERKMRID